MSLLDLHIPEWTERAACRTADPAVFYPSEGQSGHAAKAICRGCPVATDCLRFALDLEATSPGSRWGVFGGTTPNERKRFAKKQESKP